MPSAYETSLWVDYLISLGLVHKRTSASHFVYDYPSGHPWKSLSRPIIVERTWDMIPVDHISRSLRVLGTSMKDFRDFIESRQKGKGK